MNYVYLIQHNSTKEIYIGTTDNLKRRLIEHNSGGNKSTRRNSGKWIVVYTEIYRSELDAQARERRLKNHGSGKQELLKRLKNSLLET